MGSSPTLGTIEMLVLGIDPGIGRVGYAVLERVDAVNQKLITFGCLTTPTKTPVSDRLFILQKKLEEVISKYKPSLMVIEKLFFNTNVTTAMTVGQAMGVIMLTGAQAGLSIEEVTPLQVKSTLTGYGRAEKGQVQRMVMAQLGLKNKPTPDDAGDAIAVALCYCLTNYALKG